jgi:hypothetical protein
MRLHPTCRLFFLAVPLLTVPALVRAQPQTSAQQRCVVALDKDLRTVALQAGKDIDACLQQTAAGHATGSTAACVGADTRGRIEAAHQKAIADAAVACGTPPDFGAADPDDVSGEAFFGQLSLLDDLFDVDLDAALAGQTHATLACARQVTKAAAKCLETQLIEFDACAKTGLKSGAIAAESQLETCVGADPRGKIARDCDTKLAKTIDAQCVGADVTAVFAGCQPSDRSALGVCARRAGRCRACLALAAGNRLGVDCDLYDDGQANQSCLSLDQANAALDDETATLDATTECEVFDDTAPAPSARALPAPPAPTATAGKDFEIDQATRNEVAPYDLSGSATAAMTAGYAVGPNQGNATRDEMLANVKALNKEDIWYYQGHGVTSKQTGLKIGISVHDDHNNPILTADLVNKVKEDANPPSVIFLAACGTAQITQAIVGAGVEVVMGWTLLTSELGSKLPVEIFWQNLFAGKTFTEAQKAGNDDYVRQAATYERDRTKARKKRTEADAELGKFFKYESIRTRLQTAIAEYDQKIAILDQVIASRIDVKTKTIDPSAKRLADVIP